MKRRNTPAKQEVLTMFETTDTALSQDMIEQEMKGRADRATIYRILNSFCEDGIIHKITSEEGKQYYALCTTCGDHAHHHNHFHFKCTSCSTVECLKEEIVVSLPAGYSLTSANFWLSGQCKSCNQPNKRATR